MTKLNDAEQRALADGFQGPQPGSNMLPLLCFQRDGVEILGERIEELVRGGALIATPRTGQPIAQIKGGMTADYGDIPDIELTHNYWLSSR